MRKEEKYIYTSSCAYSRFNTVSNSQRKAESPMSQSKQLQAQLRLLLLSFFCFVFFNLHFVSMVHVPIKHTQKGMMHIFRTRLTTKYFPLPLVPSLCTELWGIWGVCSRKRFFRNLLWMFITFHKQVSVIKSYRPPSALLPPFLPSPCPLPPFNQPFFFLYFFHFQVSFFFLQNPVIYSNLHI